MHEDVKWLFGLLILFAAFWLASGGLSKSASPKPFLEPVIESGGNGAVFNFAHIGNNSADSINYVSRTNTTQSRQGLAKKLTALDEIKQVILDAGIQASEIQKELNTLEEASHASPLTGKLAIVGRAAGAGAAGEYIALRASPQNKDKVLLTGLRLQSSASGQGADIPKAAPLVFQNQLNREEPVYLKPGDSAYIITGRSPLGLSFRLNKCTGFFSQHQTFNPSLPSRCPKPREEDLPVSGTVYNDACRNYINSLSSCRVVTSPPLTLSPECQRYVTEEINYTKCVERHKNDADFYDPSWRVYLNRADKLWKTSRELIHLVDQNGKVIDAITY
ncbi:MAG: hypothetical protein HYV67_04050 [Candidatus Taylorbacteria bacterium]|nr:hypothetical protein [Candidatus Taylorbacteria bacterium]